MIQTTFTSFNDKYKDSVKNPFIGTYLLVAIIRNWRFVYILFNFDEEATLKSKLNTLSEYFKHHDYLYGILVNIGITFLVLIGSYILLNVSRIIVNFSEKTVKPAVYKLTEKGSTVMKSSHEKVLIERDELQRNLETERDSKFKLQQLVDKLENEKSHLESLNSDKAEAIGDLTHSNSLLNTELAEKIEELIKSNQSIISLQNSNKDLQDELEIHIMREKQYDFVNDSVSVEYSLLKRNELVLDYVNIASVLSDINEINIKEIEAKPNFSKYINFELIMPITQKVSINGVTSNKKIGYKLSENGRKLLELIKEIERRDNADLISKI